MDTNVDYHERLLEAITTGEVKNKLDLQRKKIQLCRELGLATVPPNSETLARADPETIKLVQVILRRKPMRTLSGVAVAAVMTSPAPCPHGRCLYCPGGVENQSPQSYTGKEPAARRGASYDFDPFLQVSKRIEQLEAIGHPTDKIDLIIMGGTFTSRTLQYQDYFVKGCFDAMNEAASENLEQAHLLNETAPHRCIGMTVETRPDSFSGQMADHCMLLGTTRVEFGVQLLDDDILRAVGRGHGVKEIVQATAVAKDRGLKVCYHLMPGLPGSSPELDVERFRLMFGDERFRPDMLKIYPTLVVKGTPLYESWLKGDYSPYTTEQATEVIASMKAMVPKYVRIQRIQRDIPAPLIEAGVNKGHLRELVQARMREQGIQCKCIRCHEVGLNRITLEHVSEVGLVTERYRASGGEERFISFEIEGSMGLVGYARLRLPDNDDVAHLRELKVFGQMAQLGKKEEHWQHRGFGKELVAESERQAHAAGYRALSVTSGVGVRRYYFSQGYQRNGVYMTKELKAT